MNNTSLNYSNTTSRTIRMDAEKLQSNTGPVVRPKAISYDKKRKATSAFTDNIDAKRSASTVNFGPTYKSYSPIPTLNKDENIVQRKSTVDQTVGKRRSSERTSPGDAKSANFFPGTIDNHESANEKLTDRDQGGPRGRDSPNDDVTYEFDDLTMELFNGNVNPTSNTAVHSNDDRKYLKYASCLLEHAYSQDQALKTHRIANMAAVRLKSFLDHMVLLRQYLVLVQQE